MAVPRPGVLLLFTLLAPPALYAAGGEHSVPGLFLIIAAMVCSAKLLGEVFERLGLPPVLGELVAGMILGHSALGLIPSGADPSSDVIYLLAELGVVLLLFEVGLETNLKEMFKVGPAALAVAVVGVGLPFLFGFLYWVYGPHQSYPSSASIATVGIFIGATLTATSVGITARVLGDLQRMDTVEARIILAAAVLDDVIGLVILSVVSNLARGDAVSSLGVLLILGKAIGFLVLAVAVGSLLMPRVFDWVGRLRVREAVIATALCFALALAALAAVAGSALIIGAFAAGLVLRRTSHQHAIETQLRPLVALFSPIFFVNVGAAADFTLLNPRNPGAGGLLLLAGGLTLLAILGKVAAGWAAPWQRFQRLTVGVGMVPRGEVGLIFADVGRRAGLLNDAIFSAVVLMVMLTTFIAPIWLKFTFGRRGT